VLTEAPSADDRSVLDWAAREDRILLTFDKDFGELSGDPSFLATGVILFRMPLGKPAETGRRLADLITARGDWAGHFSVIEPGRIRMRRLGA
ncbi:MAG TPA: DUF5615 family PIN-like protein, partial [Alphaproteobacteria bacterium]|nr:DUF5615 family PIN-like protein [Alphaproteobacteria bacterium]